MLSFIHTWKILLVDSLIILEENIGTHEPGTTHSYKKQRAKTEEGLI